MARSEVTSNKIHASESRPNKTPAQFCKDWLISPTTLKRQFARGQGPRRTWVNQTRYVITPEAEDEWVAARTEPPRDDAA